MASRFFRFVLRRILAPAEDEESQLEVTISASLLVVHNLKVKPHHLLNTHQQQPTTSAHIHPTLVQVSVEALAPLLRPHGIRPLDIRCTHIEFARACCLPYSVFTSPCLIVSQC